MYSPRAFLLALSLLALASAPAPAASVPPDFVVENAVPGVTFDTPTAIAFTPDGRMLVAEKRGRVYAVANGVRNPVPVWNAENEVLNQHDRGLLDVAVDPDFATNRLVYFLYSVDPDSNGVDDNDNGFGRLARYQLSLADPDQVDPATRAILMGVDWPDGPLSDSPSHSIGALRFGTDGSLFVSTGDGASYDEVDGGGLDPSAFGPGRTDPDEDIGAFRSQDLNSLCGKILRVNPATGHGYAGNPYADEDLRSVRSRVWAYGFRNPFRIAVRPGSGSADTAAADPGTVYAGDVGWTTWEELNVANAPGMNFGWPCYEGPFNTAYFIATPAHHDCYSIGTPINPAPHSPPEATWHHYEPEQSVPAGLEGNASVAGFFYTGNRYPALYQGAYFFADYGQSWIKVAVMSGNDDLVSVLAFAEEMDAPVGLVPDPANQDLHYVAIAANEIRRIRYTGSTSNSSPLAVANATPNVGVAPLEVDFSSAGSFDPDMDPITFTWIFGDGEGSTAPNPTHTYAMPGTYTATLTVADDQGGQGSDTVIVTVSTTTAFPATPVLDDFDRANGPIGGAWVDETAGLEIDGNALIQTGSVATTVWSGGVFGPDQEAYIRFDQVTVTAPEHDLMLKVQGLTWSDGHIEVRYDATFPHVAIGSYTPGVGWQTYATLAVAFQAGDQMGARAYANGTVELYKNGVLMGSASVASWPYAALGGRLGMTIVGASSSRLDDFGGGTLPVTGNTPPVATIVSPPPDTFYVEGEPLIMTALGSDAEDAPEDLAYHWQLDIHHNNHVHPSSFVSDSQNTAFIPADHEDGTGVSLMVSLVVTDLGGLTDTARVEAYPEVDLTPAGLFTMPAEPAGGSGRYGFWIHNRGRMKAAFSRWRMLLDGTLVAEGDTLVPPLDSVEVAVSLIPGLAGGEHEFRAVVDTLGQIVETSETNNSAVHTFTVVPGEVSVRGERPAAIALSRPLPNPTRGDVAMTLDLPASAPVEFSVHDLQGRAVWRGATRVHEPGRWPLVWSGRDARGRRVRPGLYLARIAAGEHVMVRRVTVIR